MEKQKVRPSEGAQSSGENEGGDPEMRIINALGGTSSSRGISPSWMRLVHGPMTWARGDAWGGAGFHWDVTNGGDDVDIRILKNFGRRRDANEEGVWTGGIACE